MFDPSTRTAYTTGSVTLSTESWTPDYALISNTMSDAKTGAQSARVGNVGSVEMNVDLTTGAGAVTVAHACYGTDGASSWEL